MSQAQTSAFSGAVVSPTSARAQAAELWREPSDDARRVAKFRYVDSVGSVNRKPSDLHSEPLDVGVHLQGSPQASAFRRDAGKLSHVFMVQTRFEGMVDSVNQGTCFTAHITRSGGDAIESAIVELPCDDVDPSDLRLLQPGARFYWIVGYEQVPFRFRKSIISFAGRRRFDEVKAANLAQKIKDMFEEEDN